jgi:hypothetical protein
MGSTQRGLVIFTFPRHTLETSNFRDPTERPSIEDQFRDHYHHLYTSGVPLPRTRTFTREEVFPLPNKSNHPSVVDENKLRKLYALGVSLMPERRGLTRDQMLSLSTTIENNLRSPQPLPEMDN